MCGESIEMAVQYKDGALHDSALSLNYTVISIDSPHMRKDSSNYLKVKPLVKAFQLISSISIGYYEFFIKLRL